MRRIMKKEDRKKIEIVKLKISREDKMKDKYKGEDGYRGYNSEDIERRWLI